jgi:hypothetical protein
MLVYSLSLIFFWGCHNEPPDEPISQQIPEPQRLPPLSPSVVQNNPSLKEQELRFIESAVTGQEYLKQGFRSLEEWNISLTITPKESHYKLHFLPKSPPKVNAEWGFSVEKESGKITDEWQMTFEEPPFH